MNEISEYLGSFSGAMSDSEIPQRVAMYLVSIFHAHGPIEKVGRGESLDLKRTAMRLDALATGELSRLGDPLMQRFKATE